MTKKIQKKLKKVAKGLSKASKTHAKQAKTIRSVLKTKKAKSYHPHPTLVAQGLSFLSGPVVFFRL